MWRSELRPRWSGIGSPGAANRAPRTRPGSRRRSWQPERAPSGQRHPENALETTGCITREVHLFDLPAKRPVCGRVGAPTGFNGSALEKAALWLADLVSRAGAVAQGRLPRQQNLPANGQWPDLCTLRAKSHGAVDVEAIFNPWMMWKRGVSLDAIFTGYCDAIEEARGLYGVEVRLTPDGDLWSTPEEAAEIARYAVAYRDRVVVGFGMSGSDRHIDAAAFARAAETARDGGLGYTPHAGVVRRRPPRPPRYRNTRRLPRPARSRRDRRPRADARGRRPRHRIRHLSDLKHASRSHTLTRGTSDHLIRRSRHPLLSLQRRPRPPRHQPRARPRSCPQPRSDPETAL